MTAPDSRQSWRHYQPGMSGVTAVPSGSLEDVTARRYELEPHILEVVPFDQMTGTAAEFGCGIATDGLRIAQAASAYIGLDFSELALSTARSRHDPRSSHFIRADLRRAPLRTDSVDHVYSHGVIHHIPEADTVWSEVARVLRPGGRFCVMVYNRRSVNYYFGISVLRRLLLIAAVVVGQVARRAAARRGEGPATVDAHLSLLRRSRGRYLFSSEWLSRNTDGPQNTYTRVYSKRQLGDALRRAGLVVDRFEVRYLNTRVNPPFNLLPRRAQEWLGRRCGWHLYALGHLPEGR